MIRMGLLGAGRIGRIHGHNVAAHPGAELVAVADALPSAAETLAAETGAKVASIDAIIADRNIDAVLICTPTDMHSDLIEAAAKAGQGRVLREARRSQLGPHPRLPRCREGRRHAADDRLQPPLRSQFRQR